MIALAVGYMCWPHREAMFFAENMRESCCNYGLHVLAIEWTNVFSTLLHCGLRYSFTQTDVMNFQKRIVKKILVFKHLRHYAWYHACMFCIFGLAKQRFIEIHLAGPFGVLGFYICVFDVSQWSLWFFPTNNFLRCQVLSGMFWCFYCFLFVVVCQKFCWPSLARFAALGVGVVWRYFSIYGIQR